MDLLNRLASPYELNPLRINPLRDLVASLVDFDKVRGCVDMPIYLSATNVETGVGRVFGREEVNLDVVMASACLPFMFHAVEIDGVPYWDGGYMGNPAIFPFFRTTQTEDVLIVQINPVARSITPTSSQEIINRVNEISTAIASAVVFCGGAMSRGRPPVWVSNWRIESARISPSGRSVR